MPQATPHELHKLQEFNTELADFVSKLPPDVAAKVAPHHAELSARLADATTNKAINWANILQIFMQILSIIGPLLNPAPTPPVATPQAGPSNG